MPKKDLTKIQRVILEAAGRSANLIAWPLPKRLKLSPGSAAIVVGGLLRKGLLEKRPAMGTDPVWKEESGKGVTLVISKTGLAASGIESVMKASVAAKQAVVAAVSQNEARRPRAGTKLAVLVDLLERKEGASIEEMATATGWQPNSVRGVISGMLTKRFGLVVASERVEGRGRTYRTVKRV